MRKLMIFLILGMGLAAAALAQSHPSDQAERQNGVDKEIAAIKRLESDYVRSVNEMDYQLADSIWVGGDQVSFIHPRGHAVGWQRIKDEFYRGTMEAFFTRRDLRLSSELHIVFYGANRDVAVVEFYWVFDAVLRKDGTPLHTEGRESQTVVKGQDGKWRIAQVHYSGPPVTGDTQGF